MSHSLAPDRHATRVPPHRQLAPRAILPLSLNGHGLSVYYSRDQALAVFHLLASSPKAFHNDVHLARLQHRRHRLDELKVINHVRTSHARFLPMQTPLFLVQIPKDISTASCKLHQPRIPSLKNNTHTIVYGSELTPTAWHATVGNARIYLFRPTEQQPWIPISSLDAQPRSAIPKPFASRPASLTDSYSDSLSRS